MRERTGLLDRPSNVSAGNRAQNAAIRKVHVGQALPGEDCVVVDGSGADLFPVDRPNRAVALSVDRRLVPVLATSLKYAATVRPL